MKFHMNRRIHLGRIDNIKRAASYARRMAAIFQEKGNEKEAERLHIKSLKLYKAAAKAEQARIDWQKWMARRVPGCRALAAITAMTKLPAAYQGDIDIDMMFIAGGVEQRGLHRFVLILRQCGTHVTTYATELEAIANMGWDIDSYWIVEGKNFRKATLEQAKQYLTTKPRTLNTDGFDWNKEMKEKGRLHW